MKSAPDLLKAYDQTPATGTPTRVDRSIWMILVMAIYDDRSGDWVHDFLVANKCLPVVEGVAHTSQLRKVHRWRSNVESEIGLPPRGRGKATPKYNKQRRRWESANPRPTSQMLLDGWYPVAVDYDALPSSVATPVPTPAPRKTEREKHASPPEVEAAALGIHTTADEMEIVADVLRSGKSKSVAMPQKAFYIHQPKEGAQKS